MAKAADKAIKSTTTHHLRLSWKKEVMDGSTVCSQRVLKVVSMSGCAWIINALAIGASQSFIRPSTSVLLMISDHGRLC
jgi:hypothetical protein